MHALCSGAVALACHLVLAQVACQGGDREHLSHVKRRTQGLRVAGKLHGFFKVRTRGREIKVVPGDQTQRLIAGPFPKMFTKIRAAPRKVAIVAIVDKTNRQNRHLLRCARVGCRWRSVASKR